MMACLQCGIPDCQGGHRHDNVPFRCPRCGAESYNDGAQGYCGRCHWWTGDIVLGRADVIARAEEDGAIQKLPGNA